MFTKIKNFFKRLFKKEGKKEVDLNHLYVTLDKLEEAHSILVKKLSEGYFGNGIIMSDEELAELKEQLNTIKIKVSPENKENVEAMVSSLDSNPIITNKEVQKSEELLQLASELWNIKKTVDNALVNVIISDKEKLFRNSMPKYDCRPISFAESNEELDKSDPDYGFGDVIFRKDEVYDKTSSLYEKEITFVDVFPEEYINHLTCLQKDAFDSGFVILVKPAKGEVIYFCKNRKPDRMAQILFLKRLKIDVPDYNEESEANKIWDKCVENIKCGGIGKVDSLGNKFVEPDENLKKEGE